jgi:hypothetical protein
MTTDIEYIICTKCKENKPRNDFSPRPNRSKGVKSACISCTKKYYSDRYQTKEEQEKRKIKYQDPKYQESGKLRWLTASQKKRKRI